jgi:hypothetical protein
LDADHPHQGVNFPRRNTAAAIIRNYSLGPPVILKALELQPPLPDDALKIVASGEKEDGVAERVSI